MSEMSCRQPKASSSNWIRHVPESLSRALERRHTLDMQQRAFQRDQGSRPTNANLHPRRPA